MVSGHLQVKKGFYYVVLSYYNNNGKRRVKYFSTGLPEKGNKSLGISTNLEAVTAQYVDVRLERKQSVLQTYHKALQPKTTVTGKEAGQETSKKAKKKSSEMEL